MAARGHHLLNSIKNVGIGFMLSKTKKYGEEIFLVKKIGKMKTKMTKKLI